MAETESSPPGAADAPQTSRAGRNLPAAIAVGVGMGAMAMGILLYAPFWWLAVLAVAIPIATLEVARRLGEAGYSIPVVPLVLGGEAMIWLTWPYGPAGLLGAFAGTVVVCMVWRLVGQGLSEQPVNYSRDIAATVFVATWIPLFAGFSALLIFQEDGGERLLIVLLGAVFSDIGGYAAGVLFGKHPMVPAISPKKSWEGFTGSLVTGIGAAVLGLAFLLDTPAWVGVPLGLLLVVTGTLGDLVESQFKRDLGIKDMGTLLPGHGGLMDRIDGMLPAAVAGWIVLTLLV